jgi:hypothetical protein
MFTFDRVPLVESNVNDPVAVALPKVTLSSVKDTKSAQAAVAPQSNNMHPAMVEITFLLMSAALNFDFIAVTPLDEPPQPPTSMAFTEFHRQSLLECLF